MAETATAQLGDGDGANAAPKLIAVLARTRREQRLSRPGLSVRLGRASNCVYRWEEFRCSPSLDATVAWAAALGYQLTLIPTDRPHDASESADRSEP